MDAHVPRPCHVVQDWSGVARELRATVAKLIHVEEALATSCTCMLCLEGLKQPTTCIPCGHTYCKVRVYNGWGDVARMV